MFKKVFNIACLLGWHEGIEVVVTNVANIEDQLRQILYNVHKWDAEVINALPLPKNLNKKLFIKSCPHCGKIQNGMNDYVVKRTKYYNSIVNKYITAISNYITYYNNSIKSGGIPMSTEDKDEQ